MAGMAEVRIPQKLRDTIGTWEATGAAWIETLPELVSALAADWDLELGAVLEPGGVLSWIATVGDTAVLKVSWPDEELRYEAEALLRWDPAIAVRVLRHDPARWAILLERLDPVTPLGDQWDDDTLAVGLSILPRLWVRADEPFTRLSTQARHWASVARERWATVGDVMSPTVIGEGLRLLEELGDDERFLLHGDWHPGNVVADDRRGWVVIDPKPLVGERAFDATAMVIHGVTDRDHLRRRVGRVAGALDLDPARLVAWTLARHIHWVLWEYAVDGGKWGAALAHQVEVLADLHGR
jgi:streptomycin 6-kinase